MLEPAQTYATVAQTVCLSQEPGPLGQWSGRLARRPHRTASLARHSKVTSGERLAKGISATEPLRLHQEMMQRTPLITSHIDLGIIVDHTPRACTMLHRGGARQTGLRVLRRSIARGDDFRHAFGERQGWRKGRHGGCARVKKCVTGKKRGCANSREIVQGSSCRKDQGEPYRTPP